MSELNNPQPDHWRSIPSAPPSGPGVPPSWGLGNAAGGFAKIITEAGRLVGALRNSKNRIDDVVADEMAGIVRSAIAEEGFNGYLFEVRVYKGIEGTPELPDAAPRLIGPGRDPINAAARHFLGPNIYAAPPRRVLYDNSRSFLIWVTESENDELEAQVLIFPKEVIALGRARAFAGLRRGLSSIESIRERSQRYGEILQELERKTAAVDTRTFLETLQRSRERSQRELERALRRVEASKRLREKASRLQKMSKILSLGSQAADLAKAIKSADVEIATANTVKTLKIEHISKIEATMNIVIERAAPGTVTPAPILP